MKELMKKLATRKGVKNFECFFFGKLGPMHYIKELIAEKNFTPI